jgi:hypothetical protein
MKKLLAFISALAVGGLSLVISNAAHIAEARIALN